MKAWDEIFIGAYNGLLSADEYLDLCGVPRTPWPPTKEHGDYCALCNRYFNCTYDRNRHMRKFHIQAVKTHEASEMGTGGENNFGEH